MKPLQNTLMCLDESFCKADLKKRATLIEGLVWSDQDSRITPQDECVCVEPLDNAERWNNIHVTSKSILCWYPWQGLLLFILFVYFM